MEHKQFFKQSYSKFYYSEDNKNIYYETNFKDINPNDNVLVFINGLLCSNYHWEKQLDYLDLKGYKILIFDYRGHFNSSGSDDVPSVSFENIIGDINGILLQENIQAITLIGHSMGVNIALEFHLKYSHFVSKLILISGTISPITKIMFNIKIMRFVIPLFKIFLSTIPKFGDFVWKSIRYNPLVYFSIKHIGFNPRRTSSDYIKRYISHISQVDFRIFFKLLNEIDINKTKNKLHNIDKPTLIITGGKDRVIPQKYQKVLSLYIKDSIYFEIPTASHVPQTDFPKIINDKIEDFIKS